MKNCIIAQSGGPTVAINASLAGVIEECLDKNAYDHIYGSLQSVIFCGQFNTCPSVPLPTPAFALV